MAKYRILKREYPNGQIEYEVQKKVLFGLFWWNFENIDATTTGIYSTLDDAEMAIKMHKEKPKVTIIKV
jgi:hypothetical protein